MVSAGVGFGIFVIVVVIVGLTIHGLRMIYASKKSGANIGHSREWADRRLSRQLNARGGIPRTLRADIPRAHIARNSRGFFDMV